MTRREAVLEALSCIVGHGGDDLTDDVRLDLDLHLDQIDMLNVLSFAEDELESDPDMQMDFQHVSDHFLEWTVGELIAYAENV